MWQFRRLVFFILFFTGTAINAQTLEQQKQNIYYACKIWGYVKYFHTEIAKGNVNWDEILLDHIDEVIEAENPVEFNERILNLISSAGNMQLTNSHFTDVPDDLKTNLNTDWFDDNFLSTQVTDKLNLIKENFRPRKHELIDDYFGGYTGFSEDIYDPEDYTSYSSAAIRMLGFFRYWNIVEYFFPYKDVMDQTWDQTLGEFALRIFENQNEDEFQMLFMELCTRTNDSHAKSYGPYIDTYFYGEYYLPLKLMYLENKSVVVKSFDSIVPSGSILTYIDGVKVETLREGLRKYTFSSNESRLEHNVNDFLLRTSNSGSVQITYLNPSGEEISKIVERIHIDIYKEFAESSYDNWEIMKHNGLDIGYVHMGKLTEEEVPQMFDELKDTEGIIFDIRNYPKGTLWTIVNYLFDAPFRMVDFMVPDVQYPGTVDWISPEFGWGEFDKVYFGKIAIIFNESAQSQAEYTVMGLEQYAGAVKIGSQTSGADGNVVYINLPHEILTRITGLGVFYPDRSPTQRIGIVPDIFVKPTISGITEGRDELLEAALNELSGVTDIEADTETLPAYFLNQNYPNPFNPTTTIQYKLASSGFVDVSIYNLLGQKVKTLVSKSHTIGQHQVEWDGTDDIGWQVGSGVYLYRISSNGWSDSKKMMLLK